MFSSSFCNANVLVFNSGLMLYFTFGKSKKFRRTVVRQGKFHTHGRLSVQIGTDNEQQWINLSNSRGRVLVYAFRLL